MTTNSEQLTSFDQDCLARAHELALEAEAKGNMPIGSVFARSGEVIAEGRNELLIPTYNPGAHAEMVALAQVPKIELQRANEITCYSTLEPCIMCTSTLILHGIRRVVFGALDQEGGGRFILDHLPPYYSESTIHWIGPVDPKTYDPLYLRALERFEKLPCGCP